MRKMGETLVSLPFRLCLPGGHAPQGTRGDPGDPRGEGSMGLKGGADMFCKEEYGHMHVRPICR